MSDGKVTVERADGVAVMSHQDPEFPDIDE